MVRKCNGGNPYLQARRKGVGAYAPPPLDTKNIFLGSFIRKLIVHKHLYLNLLCSSKIADFRATFVKKIAVKAPLAFLYPCIYNRVPPPFFKS